MSAVNALRSRRSLALDLLMAAVAPGALLSMGPVSVGPMPNPFGYLVNAAFGAGVPVLFGLWVGTRRRLVASLRDRAARLERERHLLADRARIEERTRIAREMHDVVAHRVSLMVLQAGALEVAVGGDPAQAAQTATVIRSTGRQALEELRSLMGVLRTDLAGSDADAPLAPQPVLADLPALFGETREAGLDVSVTVDGEWRPVDSIVERTAYRIVQEALTNVHKHAGPVAAHVKLGYRPRSVTVDVTNAPAAPAAPPDRNLPGGHGLVGLRERAALLGGTFEAGPQRYGGWQMHVELPLPLPAEGADP